MRTLWRYGDTWADLTADLAAVTDVAAVVTWSGAVRLLQPTEGRQVRAPRFGLPDLPGDRFVTALGAITHASPCGLNTWADTPDAWHKSTPLVSITVGALDDLVDALNDIDAQADLIETARAGDMTTAGHPEQRCPTLNCAWEKVTGENGTTTWT